MQDQKYQREKAKPESKIPQQTLFRDVDAKRRHAITIVDKEPAEIYRFWRDLTNLPKFMKGIFRVSMISPKRSLWTAQVKGASFEWEAEIVEDTPGEMLSWRSLEDSDVRTNGTVWFSPAKEGTVVSLLINYEIPGGKFAELAAFLMGENPDTLAKENLYRLRALLETGEIPTIEGQPNGREENTQTLH